MTAHDSTPARERLRLAARVAAHEVRARALRLAGRDPGPSLSTTPASTPELRDVRDRASRIVLEAAGWAEAVGTLATRWDASTRRTAAAIAPESFGKFVVFAVRATTEALRQSVEGPVTDRTDLKSGLEYEARLNRSSDAERHREACRLAPDLADAAGPADGVPELQRLVAAQATVERALTPYMTDHGPLPSILLEGAARHLAR